MSSGPLSVACTIPRLALLARTSSFRALASLASSLALPDPHSQRTQSRHQYHRSLHPCLREYFPGHATPSTAEPAVQKQSRQRLPAAAERSEHASNAAPASSPGAASSLVGRCPVLVCTNTGTSAPRSRTDLSRSRRPPAPPRRRTHDAMVEQQHSARHESLACASGVVASASSTRLGHRARMNAWDVTTNGRVMTGRPTGRRRATRADWTSAVVAAPSSALRDAARSRR